MEKHQLSLYFKKCSHLNIAFSCSVLWHGELNLSKERALLSDFYTELLFSTYVLN